MDKYVHARLRCILSSSQVVLHRQAKLLLQNSSVCFQRFSCDSVVAVTLWRLTSEMLLSREHSHCQNLLFYRGRLLDSAEHELYIKKSALNLHCFKWPACCSCDLTSQLTLSWCVWRLTCWFKAIFNAIVQWFPKCGLRPPAGIFWLLKGPAALLTLATGCSFCNLWPYVE